MRGFVAFVKKELLERLRAGRLIILGLVFFLLGVMNPAIAKLTPWLLEAMSDSLAESGMTVTEVTVDAMTSWVQFFKNIPMGLIVFVLLESGSLTREYQSGSLIPVITKGLSRRSVILAKTGVLFALWTVCFWLCYGVTYLYNDVFWDNSIAHHLLLASAAWWLLGLWTLSLCVLFSASAKSNGAVLLGTGGVFLLSYLVTLFPKLARFSPAYLMGSQSLLTQLKDPSDLLPAAAIALTLTLLSTLASIPILNRRGV